MYSKKMQRNNEMRIPVVWHVTLGAGLVVREISKDRICRLHIQGSNLEPFKMKA